MASQDNKSISPAEAGHSLKTIVPKKVSEAKVKKAAPAEKKVRRIFWTFSENLFIDSYQEDRQKCG
jgi:hypothetical protein